MRSAESRFWSRSGSRSRLSGGRAAGWRPRATCWVGPRRRPKPVRARIRQLRDEIFTLTSAVGPSVESEDPAEGARQEGARLAVRNGSGIEGLATGTSDYLIEQGLQVAEVGNADRLH